jgi:hypothetical protein
MRNLYSCQLFGLILIAVTYGTPAKSMPRAIVVMVALRQIHFQLTKFKIFLRCHSRANRVNGQEFMLELDDE